MSAKPSLVTHAGDRSEQLVRLYRPGDAVGSAGEAQDRFRNSAKTAAAEMRTIGRTTHAIRSSVAAYFGWVVSERGNHALTVECANAGVHLRSPFPTPLEIAHEITRAYTDTPEGADISMSNRLKPLFRIVHDAAMDICSCPEKA
jgi:hypothetical protein